MGAAHPNEEILIYGFGSTIPEKVITKKGFLSKRSLCFRFDQHLHEDVYLFRGPALIHTYPSWDENASLDISEYESYTILFGFQVFHYGGMDSVKLLLALKSDMEKYEIHKGEIQSDLYPALKTALQNIENASINVRHPPGGFASFYGVGARLPAVEGPVKLNKILFCILFKQSIQQEVKVFYRNFLYATLSNCFDPITTTHPGKYVVVFKSDAIHSMSPIVAGKELEKIEQQLSLEMEEVRKKKAEEDSKKTAPSVPEEIRLFGFGSLSPQKVLTQKVIVTKRSLCFLFEQRLAQEVHIFRGPTRLHTFPVSEDSARFPITEYGPYVVVFEDDVRKVKNLEEVELLLSLLHEMIKFELFRGDPRSEAYPMLNSMIQEVEERISIYGDCSGEVPAFYAVEAKLPVVRGLQSLMKIYLCAIFKQSIHQDVKIFYKNELYATLSNCFTPMLADSPGKYVVVFKSDAIYSMPPKEAGNELKKIEQQLSLEIGEEKRKKTAKNNKNAIQIGKYLSNSEKEIRIYAFGCITPKGIVPHKAILSKRYFCSLFNKPLDQDVHLFQGPKHLLTFPAAKDNGEVHIMSYGSYIIVFEDEFNYFKSFNTIQIYLTAMNEMIQCELQKGDLYCQKSYPMINYLLLDLKLTTSKKWDACSRPKPAFYGVGDKVPVLRGPRTVMKLILCILFRQSLYQDVKIFYNNVLHTTLSNCFETVISSEPGKYIVVFGSDLVYIMPPTVAGKELKKIEEQFLLELEQGKRKAANEDSKESAVTTATEKSPSTPEGEVLLYGYGCLQPKFTLPQDVIIDKYILCIVFGQRHDQQVHIFSKNTLSYTFPAEQNRSLRIAERGRFVVVFDVEVVANLPTIAEWLTMLHEMILFEKDKGSLRSIQYPASKYILQHVHSVTKAYEAVLDVPMPAIYGVGAKEPAFLGNAPMNKTIICMLFNQSIYQDVKVFYDYRLHAVLTNCLTYMDISKAGKYVVVFKTDTIYSKTPTAIGYELRRIEEKLAMDRFNEEEKKKTEKNSKKTAKKKKKKLLQQTGENSQNKKADSIDSGSKLGQPVSHPEEGQDPVTGSGDSIQAAKKKRGKKQKKTVEEPSEEPAEVPAEPSDSEEPTVDVRNRFASLIFNENAKSLRETTHKPVVQQTTRVKVPGEPDELKPPTIDENQIEPNQIGEFREFENYYDELLREVLAESVPFEKPKVYAKNKFKHLARTSAITTENKQLETNWKTDPTQKCPVVEPLPSTSSGYHEEGDETTASSYTQEDGSHSEDGSSLFEELPVKQMKESSRGARAVVVGIHQKGLIVQTLPPKEGESEFFLLDYCSQSTSASHSLTDVAFDVKLLHVFLKLQFWVVSVATLGNDFVVNENENQRGKKIEKRVVTYALDGNTWSRGRFRRGRRDSIDEELKLKKKRERKIICLIVKTDLEDNANMVGVVGPPSHLSFPAQLDKNKMRDEFAPLTSVRNVYFKKHQFIIADSFQGDPFFKLHIMFGTLCLIKSYKAEENFLELTKKNENMYMELHKCLRESEIDVGSILLQGFPHTSDPPNGDTFLFNIEKLTTNEEYMIRTCCKELIIQNEKKRKNKKKNKKKFQKKSSPEGDAEEYDIDEQYNLFRLYIRDPALSICRFNSYDALRNSQLYTIRTKATMIVERGELLLVLYLNSEQVRQVLPTSRATKGNNVWRESVGLKIYNPVLEREKHSRFGILLKSDADVVITEIILLPVEVEILGRDGLPFKYTEYNAKIKLRPAKNSKDIFEVLREFQADFSKEISQIGPSSRDGASETLATGLLKFKAFYQNQKFFNWWRGYKDPDVPENLDYLNNLQKEIEIQNGLKPEKPYKLDESQSTAVQHAFYRDGITGMGAPPGSGKTLLSSGLIIKCYKTRMDERMILTATTNEGVDNGVEKIVQLAPGFNISREMSKKGEDEVREVLAKYCLRYQSIDSEQTHPVLLKVRKEYKNVLAYFKKAKTLKDKLNRLEILHYAESKVKRTYLRTIIPFCGASTPALLVRHAEHYNLVIDDKEGRHRRWDMKHMVVDEASQMPYYTSLALCCSFPNLERITIMGDRMQLGPHCVLPQTGDLLSELCRLSELDRINGLKTVEEFTLRMNYRSPQWIVETMEQPHYGTTFASALKDDDRTLAYTLNLPLLKCYCRNNARPAAFINIKAGDDCHNASEREGVLKLLIQLMERGTLATGISILCYHRKQKEEMEKTLKPFNFGKPKVKSFMEKLGGVHTIDSFQGRENDIVIICTTKSAGIEIEGKKKSFYQHHFQFVGDPRRGLVAVSRAKEAFYVFGQWQYLQLTGFWKDKVVVMKRAKLMYDEDFSEMF